KELLDMYWPQIDPTDPGGQFHDRGESYQTAIFYHNDEQKKIAEDSKKEIEDKNIFKKPIVTQIREAKPFYREEEYHQDFYKKDTQHYQEYRRCSTSNDF